MRVHITKMVTGSLLGTKHSTTKVDRHILLRVPLNKPNMVVSQNRGTPI